MRSPGRACHAIAALLMAVYVATVLVGKLAAGAPSPLALGDVGEFLVVLASIVFFIAGILATPDRADRKGGGPR